MIKKILIISNDPLSLSNSNGRTLMNLFDPKDKDSLANFYINPCPIEGQICSNYFCVTDKESLEAFINNIEVGSVIIPAETLSQKASSSSSKNGIKKTPLTMIIRNFVWNSNRWIRRFLKWADDYKPQVILLQAGDSSFLYNLTNLLSDRYNIPILIYNSEDYCFKDYCYFKDAKFSKLLYPVFRRHLYKSVKKTINLAVMSIYITDALKNRYDIAFNKPSTTIYTGSSMICNAQENSGAKIFSYLGNLGLNRHVGLIEIANALNSIDKSYKLDIYGPIPNNFVKDALENCKGVNYKGVIPYSKVIEVMSRSSLLFHSESFDDYYIGDVMYGFSTKIADSLSSGVCFVIYGPHEISCMEYLKSNNCACVINDKEELTTTLRELINNKSEREYYISNALSVAKKNHNIKTNRLKMEHIINSL